MVEFLPVKKKRIKKPVDSENRLQIRIPKIFKAKLKQLAFQRKTTPSKIIRSYIRYCLEKDIGKLPIPQEEGRYFSQWMKD